MTGIVYFYGPAWKALYMLILEVQMLMRCPFSHVKDEVVADVEARIATWTFLPVGIYHYLLVTL